MLRLARSFALDNIWSLVGSATATVVGITSNFLMPYIVGKMADQLVTGATEIELFGIELEPISALCALGATLVLTSTAPIIRSVATSSVAPYVRKKLADKLNEHELAQSLEHHLGQDPGHYSHLSTILDRTLPTLTSEFFNDFFPTVLEMGFAVGIICDRYGLTVGLSLGANIVVYILYNVGTKVILTVAREEYQVKSAEADSANKDLQEQYISIHDSKTVRYALKKASNFNEQAYLAECRYNLYSYLVQLGQNLIISTGFSLITGIAAQRIIQGDIQPSEFFLIFTYLSNTAAPMATLGSTLTSLIAAHSDIKVFFDVIDTHEPTPNPFPHAPFQLTKPADIEFKHVSFERDDKKVLHDINLTIRAGEMVMLVGLSGSGKTTLLRLLNRNHLPSQGEIFLGGQNTKEVDLQLYQSFFSCVTQHAGFGDATIFQIVASGAGDRCEEVTEEEVIKALETAQLTEFVKTLPNGIHELIGASGRRLSGGEKQRLAIARAVINQAGVLTLDEATSALDAITRAAILAEMRKLRGEKVTVDSKHHLETPRTIICVSHDLTGADAFDSIIVMDNGRVVAQGKHQELLALKDGKYAELWKHSQHQFQEMKDVKQSPGTTAAKPSPKTETRIIPFSLAASRNILMPPHALRVPSPQPPNDGKASQHHPSGSSSNAAGASRVELTLQLPNSPDSPAKPTAKR